MRRSALCLSAACALVLGACTRPDPAGWQGYLEGEFVYVAAPIAGQLDTLAVQKGARVAAGTPLFTLERSNELAAQRQAAAELQTAQNHLADLEKGARPSELDAIAARLEAAQTAADLSGRELERVTRLHEAKVLSDDDFDHARLTHEGDLKQVAEVGAELTTAGLGARVDAVAGADSDVAAARAALARADWSVAQKAQAAPCAGLVYDTLYREGEFAAAGTPVVALLPPENLKVRFFVAEPDFAGIKAGDPVRVSVPGLPAPLTAHVSYLSPQPEYTPPVLYNRDNRAKLVFMVEALFADPVAARDLHPGQPVDVLPAR
jgi:HlyD family secretion protein